MVQTATHIFGLALAMSSANAPRIQNRQEGTMRSRSGLAFFERERPKPFGLVAPSRRVIDIANSIYALQWGEL
jgi:hypothetical protein